MHWFAMAGPPNAPTGCENPIDPEVGDPAKSIAGSKTALGNKNQPVALLSSSGFVNRFCAAAGVAAPRNNRPPNNEALKQSSVLIGETSVGSARERAPLMPDRHRERAAERQQRQPHGAHRRHRSGRDEVDVVGVDV